MTNQKRLILLVDDDSTFRERLAKAFNRRGHEVLQAACVEAAMEIIPVENLTDAVLDMRMPGEPGVALIPALRQRNSHTRIVVLTGFGSIPAALAAVRAGAQDFLTKPADADQILSALDGNVNQRHAGDIPTLDQVEWDHIQRILSETNHNISATARLLGIDRRSLQRKLAKYSPH